MIYLYYLIPGVILVASLGVVIYLVLKNKSKLSSLDLEAMKSHQQKEAKFNILEGRLKRRVDEIKGKVQDKSFPWGEKIKVFFVGIYQKIVNLEQKYKEESKKNVPKNQEDKELMRQKLGQLVQEGDDLLDKKEYTEAEKKYIEAIGIDSQNLDAYCGLSEVYLGLKDYTHAQETLDFAKQLDPDNESLWCSLGALYQGMDKPDDALDSFKQAVKLAPKSPKCLDLLLEQSILNKDRYEAKNAFKKLQEVNPENQKLIDYEEDIKNI